MCRILCVRGEEFEIRRHLMQFARIARDSPEYQGHGWGCAYLEEGRWKLHKSINPIWEDRLDGFQKTTLLLAHARSAFRDEGIAIENNMPFFDGERVFIFNGELHGVRIRESGRIGAEKIFNYIKRFDEGDLLAAIRKGTAIIRKRSRHIRAMNFIMADLNSAYISTLFNQEQEYFQMHEQKGPVHIICSAPYPEGRWEQIPNGTTEALR